MKTSKKNVSFTDLFSMGSFDEYNFNEKVETCFMRLFQFTSDWEGSVSHKL